MASVLVPLLTLTALPFSSSILSLSPALVPRSPGFPGSPASPIDVRCNDNGKSSLPSPSFFPLWAPRAFRAAFTNLSDLCYLNPINNCGCVCVPNTSAIESGSTSAGQSPGRSNQAGASGGTGGAGTGASNGYHLECSIATGGDPALFDNVSVCRPCRVNCICASVEEWQAMGSQLNPDASPFVPGDELVYCLLGRDGCREGNRCETVGNGEDAAQGFAEVLWGLASGVGISGLGSCVVGG